MGRQRHRARRRDGQLTEDARRRGGVHFHLAVRFHALFP